MTREELEAAVWQALARAGYSQAPGTSGAEAVRRDQAFIDTILAAADKYATAEATDAIRTADELGAT